VPAARQPSTTASVPRALTLMAPPAATARLRAAYDVPRP
jgi:hypothetical protein